MLGEDGVYVVLLLLIFLLNMTGTPAVDIPLLESTSRLNLRGFFAACQEHFYRNKLPLSAAFFKLKEKMTMLFTLSVRFWSSPAHKVGSEFSFFLSQRALNTQLLSQRKVLSPLFRPSAASSGKRGETLVPAVAAVPPQRGVPGARAKETLPCCSPGRSRQSICKPPRPVMCRSQGTQYVNLGVLY